MQRDKPIRGLRIAWTAVFGILCVQLTVLWVRSYFVGDSLQLRMPVARAGAISANAALAVYLAVNGNKDRTFWLVNKHKHVYEVELFSATTFRTVPIYSNDNTTVPAAYGLQFPHWFLVSLSVAIAFLPWLRWKFSLRTLLIATTVIAVLLGLVVWMTR